MRASIIIPNYNTAFLLRKNIPVVLRAAKNKKNKIHEVIVVDDASPDESVAVLKERFPEVKLIMHKVNRGFSHSVNTGVRGSSGDLIILLNTDVLPAENFMEPVIRHFDDENVFAVSLNEKGHSWAKGKFENGYLGHEPGKKTQRVHETFWISGGSGVFKRDIWKKLGGLDQNLLAPFYWEDLDICYRAAKRGYRLLWEPGGKVVHEHETTMSQIPRSYLIRIQERNLLRVNWKNLTSPRLFRKHLAGVVKRTLRHPGYLRVVLMALAKLPDIKRARAKEIKESIVSDEAILAKFK